MITDPEKKSDKQLNELAVAAQQHPSRSRERRHFLSLLLYSINYSEKRYRGTNIPSEMYNDALQETFLYVCNNIEKYDPARSNIMTWFNTRLFWSVRELYQHKRRIPLPLSALSESISIESIPDLNSQKISSSTEEIKDYILKDPDKIFRSTHLKSHPGANFQYIFLRSLEGLSRSEIARELNVPEQTLYSFLRRCAKKFAPILEEVRKNSTEL